MHVLWITSGLGCDGDSIAMTAATNPTLEDLLRGSLPGIPPIVLYNPVFAFETGDDFMRALFDAAEGKLDPFILVLEGSVPNEELSGDGHWAGHGRRPRDRAADPHLQLDRPARAPGRGCARTRHVRRIRRHPGDAQQPDRRDGPERLPGRRTGRRASGSRS